MKKRIMIIGDSLALPGHLNRYEETWIYLLKENFSQFDFITYLRRALSTDVLTSNGGGLNGVDKLPKGADCLEFYQPDIVILQLGIVDCAPRLINQNSLEYKIVNRLPRIIGNLYIGFLKKVRKRSTKRAYVPPVKFKQNLTNYLDRCGKNQVKSVIAIGIAYPDKRMIERNPGVIDAIKQYNDIYLDFSKKYSFIKTINPLDSRKHDDVIFEDGYHPNQIGHRLVFETLNIEINKCQN